MEHTCSRCGTVLPAGARYCPNCGWGGPASEYLPMKWFQFIIYVQLFLSALANLATGLGQLTGQMYGEGSGLVYRLFPALRAVDMGMGLASLALAAAAIVVRQKLARYRQGAPRLYLLFCGVSVGLSLVYAAAASLALGHLVLDASVVVNLLGNVVLLLLNRVYFRRRAALFVN